MLDFPYRIESDFYSYSLCLIPKIPKIEHREKKRKKKKDWILNLQPFQNEILLIPDLRKV